MWDDKYLWLIYSYFTFFFCFWTFSTFCIELCKTSRIQFILFIFIQILSDFSPLLVRGHHYYCYKIINYSFFQWILVFLYQHVALWCAIVHNGLGLVPRQINKLADTTRKYFKVEFIEEVYEFYCGTLSMKLFKLSTYCLNYWKLLKTLRNFQQIH